jgi:hypothetical protein
MLRLSSIPADCSHPLYPKPALRGQGSFRITSSELVGAPTVITLPAAAPGNARTQLARTHPSCALAFGQTIPQ